MNDSISDNGSKLELSASQAQSDIVIGFIWFAAITVTVIYFPNLYKKVRSKFPVTVNCWFCNKNTKVPYDDANCWDCPFCDQYNGFNQDGGYNKEIKEQYSPSFNTRVFNTNTHQLGRNNVKNETISSNGLCKLCNINQQLKIQQLARFVPLDEDNYDCEVEHFREQLEKSYRLCSQCEKKLKQILKNQQYNLLKDRLNYQKEKTKFIKLNVNRYDHQLILRTLRKFLCLGLKFVSGIISFMMFLSFLNKFETEEHFLKSTLPDMPFLDCQPILQEFLRSMTYSYDVKKELISIGLLCYAISSFYPHEKHHLHHHHHHPSLLIFWGILYSLSWTDMTGLQVMVSAICVLLSIAEIHQSPEYTLKKISNYRCENEESPETTGHSASETTPTQMPVEHCPTEHKIPSKKVNEAEELSEIFGEAKVHESVEDCSIIESRQVQADSFQDKSAKESQTPCIKRKSVFNKNFLGSLTGDRIEKELSPPPEIFHNLNNLHISNTSCRSEKPHNFLFENHNFEDRCKRNSSIIKSPKLLKTNISPWTNGEMGESVSRSSTPSSGYSSQKADKADTCRGNFTFPKTVSPVPFVRTTPPEGFDYWDKNSLFGANNFNYFSPGYIPFQPFPAPMGHTTVFTYGRPGNYPFPVTPSPGSQGYGFSPGHQVPRLSDVSETDNLFHNASKSYQWDQRWSKMKSFLYNISMFFNVISTCFLVYFTWSGVISLTGK